VSDASFAERMRVIPEYVAKTTYGKIHAAAFATVSEGHCPTCNAQLEHGWCAACRHRWSCHAAGDRSEIILNEDGNFYHWVEWRKPTHVG
jgi:hypothetical protein